MIAKQLCYLLNGVASIAQQIEGLGAPKVVENLLVTGFFRREMTLDAANAHVEVPGNGGESGLAVAEPIGESKFDLRNERVRIGEILDEVLRVIVEVAFELWVAGVDSTTPILFFKDDHRVLSS